jgi:CrtC N-terminal lipocalin domain
VRGQEVQRRVSDGTDALGGRQRVEARLGQGTRRRDVAVADEPDARTVDRSLALQNTAESEILSGEQQLAHYALAHRLQVIGPRVVARPRRSQPMSRARASPLPARLGATPEDYARLGIKRGAVEPFEDGARTDGAPGTYEWWYFDAHPDDGAKLVVVFYTKDFADLGKRLSPHVGIDLTLPDGTTTHKIADLDPAAYTASTESCDVRIGENFFAGDLHTYRIHARVEDLEVDVTLTGQVPAWRPESGYFLFGETGEHEFAWLPSVPQGEVEATYSIAGRKSTATGIGYHDHNWGNELMLKLMHHWYWARGAAGPYSVIASYITAEEKYGYTPLPVFMLARDGEVIAEDSGKVAFEELGRYTDTETGKPVAKLAGFDAAYLRFAGELRIEHYQGPELVDSHTDDALWELMYFGKARP